MAFQSWTCQVMESLLKHSGSADEVGVTGEAFALNMCGFPCFFLGWEQKNPTCEYMMYDIFKNWKFKGGEVPCSLPASWGAFAACLTTTSDPGHFPCWEEVWVLCLEVVHHH